MDKAALIQRLMKTFIEELSDHAQALDRQLLQLEKEQPAEARAKLFRGALRSVHTLKGAARSVGQEAIEQLCHDLEDALGRLQITEGPISSLDGKHLAQVTAFLKAAGGQLSAGLSPSNPALTALIRSLPSLNSENPTLPTINPIPEVLPPATPSAPGESSSIRVAVTKVDTLLDDCGELQIQLDSVETWRQTVLDSTESLRLVRKQLKTLLQKEQRSRMVPARRTSLLLPRIQEEMERLGAATERLLESLVGKGRHLRQIARQITRTASRMRMVSFTSACAGLERTVHELARARGKQVELVVAGGEVELDRVTVDALRDPLLHLARNAVDHGIEAPEERRRAGKPPVGRITLETRLNATQVTIMVRDDGRGLDCAAIRRELERLGQPVPRDQNALQMAVFEPGFSTARSLTEVSGRGIGLDIVTHFVHSQGGKLDVASDEGRGLRVSLTVPATQAALRVLLVAVQASVYAIPTSGVETLMRVSPSEIRSVAGGEAVAHGSDLIPLASLAGLISQRTNPAKPTTTTRKRSRTSVRPRPVIMNTPGQPGKHSLVVLHSGRRRAAVAVDAFLGEQEVAVKSLGPRFSSFTHLLGATVLSDGRVAVLLSSTSIVDWVMARKAIAPVLQPVTGTPKKKRIILADDSVTTRALEQTILEASGFDVIAVADGKSAWDVLEEYGADAVVTDVEMPRLTGLELTRRIRSSGRFSSLPVVLVTALAREADRVAGLEAGANAYIVKSSFDQRELLESLSLLL